MKEGRARKQIPARGSGSPFWTPKSRRARPICSTRMLSGEEHQKHLGTIKSSNPGTEMSSTRDEVAACNLASIT